MKYEDDWVTFIKHPMVLNMLNKAGALGVPERQEENRLIRSAQEGDESARDMLIVRHSPFVVTQVKRMLGRGVDHLDLFQEGLAGLSVAIGKFDTSRSDIRLISYGVWWINQSMLVAVYMNTGIIRVPVNRHVLLSKVRRALRDADGILSVEQVMERFKLKRSVAEDMIIASSPVTSLSAPANTEETPDDADERGDILSVPFVDEVADMREFEWAQELIATTKGIDRRAAYVLEQRYLHERTLDDIGTDLGVCRERVRQIIAVALGRVSATARKRDMVNGISRADRRSMITMGEA